jgi:peroxiredoxin
MILVVASAAAVAGYFTSMSMRTATSASQSFPAGAEQKILGITLPDLDGTDQGLEQWRGKVLVVNFWATWCPPCIKEIPEFASVSRLYADAPVQFVGISIDTAENVRDFAERFDVPYPLLIGSTQTLSLATDIGNSARALPFTVILDRNGSINEVVLGTLSEEDLIERIQALVGS